MPKPPVNKTFGGISRITPPSKLLRSYRVLGGLNDDILLTVDELTENEAKYILCHMIDRLKIIGVAIDTGNLPSILESLKGLKKYYENNG